MVRGDDFVDGQRDVFDKAIIKIKIKIEIVTEDGLFFAIQ